MAKPHEVRGGGLPRPTKFGPSPSPVHWPDSLQIVASPACPLGVVDDRYSGVFDSRLQERAFALILANSERALRFPGCASWRAYAADRDAEFPIERW